MSCSCCGCGFGIGLFVVSVLVGAAARFALETRKGTK